MRPIETLTFERSWRDMHRALNMNKLEPAPFEALEKNLNQDDASPYFVVVLRAKEDPRSLSGDGALLQEATEIYELTTTARQTLLAERQAEKERLQEEAVEKAKITLIRQQKRDLLRQLKVIEDAAAQEPIDLYDPAGPDEVIDGLDLAELQEHVRALS